MLRAFLLLLLTTWSTLGLAGPRVDLKIRKVYCSERQEGWKIRLQSFEKKPIPLNQFEVRFWLREQPEVTKGRVFFNGEWIDSGVGYKVIASTSGSSCQAHPMRVASAQVTMQVLHDGVIRPGEAWESQPFGVQFDVPHDFSKDYSWISDPNGNKCDDTSSFVQDPHFCLYYRGTLVQEFIAQGKADGLSGREPDCFLSHRKYDPATDPMIAKNRSFYEVPSTALPLPRISGLTSMQVGPLSAGRRPSNGLFMSQQDRNEQLIQATRQRFAEQQAEVEAQIRLASQGGTPASGFTYDENGNTLSDPWDNIYTYDPENHLVAVSGPIIGNISYTYDGDGLLVQKVINGVTTTYLWSEVNPTGIPQIIEEKVNGNLKVVYTWGQQLISQSRKLDSGDWQTRYFGHDGQGNVRNLTDENGQITDLYEYDGFGRLISQLGTSINNFRYQEQYLDPDLRMYYLRSRWYKTDLGRFWTADSFEGDRESLVGLNRYIYASDDPLNRIDPEGTFDIATSMASVDVQGILSSMPSANFTNNLLGSRTRNFKLKVGFRQLGTLAGKAYHHSFLVLEQLNRPLYWGFFASGTGNSDSIQGSRSAAQAGSNHGGTSSQRPGLQDNSVYGHLIGVHGAYDASANADYQIAPAKWQNILAPGYLSFDAIKSQLDMTMQLIEALNINYNPISTNSNASARTMLESIGVHGTVPQAWVPGWDTKLY